MGAGLGSAQVRVMASFAGREVGEQVEIAALRQKTGIIGTELSRILSTLRKRRYIILLNAAHRRLDVFPPAAHNRAKLAALTLEGKVYLSKMDYPSCSFSKNEAA